MPTNAPENQNDIFSDTLTPRQVTSFTLMRGVTDFSNLQQYDLFETGYSFLICLQIPKFLSNAKAISDNYEMLINNYCHIIEYDFRGCTGIEDITVDTNPLTNGITDLNMITRVTEQGGSSFSMNYFERSGSIITKTHELFLRGIKDPRTEVKRYLGQIVGPRSSTTNTSYNENKKAMEAGFQNEVFHYLLIVTDNTAFNVEKAFILASCQPTAANYSQLYNAEKGTYQFQELNIQMNGIPLTGRIVNKKAADFLKYINSHTCFDEMQFGYNIFGNEDDNGVNIDAIGDSFTASKVFNGNDGIQDKTKYTPRQY